MDLEDSSSFRTINSLIVLANGFFLGGQNGLTARSIAVKLNKLYNYFNSNITAESS